MFSIHDLQEIGEFMQMTLDDNDHSVKVQKINSVCIYIIYI